MINICYYMLVCVFTVTEADAAPGIRGRSQEQSTATAGQKWQTGGVPGPGPPHWPFNTNETGDTSLSLLS